MAAKVRGFVPDCRQLIGGIQHVVHEYANLMSAAHYSMHGKAPWRTHCDDAFLLGCRKLGDFLLDSERSKRNGAEQDDILALDYLPTNSTIAWELPIWNALWRDTMNKQLAHIAYDRKKSWVHTKWVPMLRAEFCKAWWDFQDAITDKDYKEEFDTLLTKRKRELRTRGINLGRQ